MSVAATSLAQSVAALADAERAESRDREKEKRIRAQDRRAPEDQDLVVVEVELPEAVRDVEQNTREEARSDRQSRPQYAANAQILNDQGSTLDISG